MTTRMARIVLLYIAIYIYEIYIYISYYIILYIVLSENGCILEFRIPGFGSHDSSNVPSDGAGLVSLIVMAPPAIWMKDGDGPTDGPGTRHGNMHTFWSKKV